MSDSHFELSEFPLAYLITVRCYGTWLRGDERLSIDRHGWNVYGLPRRFTNPNLLDQMQRNMRSEPIILDEVQRKVVDRAIREVCDCRGFHLWALNVRTNHFHAVVSAKLKPEPIANAFKSYATRSLREAGLLAGNLQLWARGRSRRYLWKPKHLSRAIDYVIY